MFISLAAIVAFACAGPAPSSSPAGATPTLTTGPVSAPPTATLPPPVIFPTAEPTPAELRHGPEGLIADLEDAGAAAAVADSFDGEPLASVQTLVCVDGEVVRVFPYSSEQERAAVSAQIDPDDPSNIGTAIVDWAGWPKFWQRDRIIVLYLGRDDGTIALLTDLMGQPFAQGQGRPQRLPSAC